MLSILLILNSLMLTVAVECSLALILKSKKLAYAVFLCNLLTNPLLNFAAIVYINFIGWSLYLPLLVFLEVCVITGEAYLLRAMMQYKFKKSFLFSLFFNACSFAAGILLTAVLQLIRPC